MSGPADEDSLTAVKSARRLRLTLGGVTLTFPLSPAGAAVPVASMQELLDAASRLKAGWQAGAPSQLLAGKNLAVLQPAGSDAASALHRAASDLGARVAQVSLGEPPPAPSEFAHIARLLGRLYDGIDAGDTAPAAVLELERCAGVPVFRGLADETHPAFAFAAQMDMHSGCTEADALADNRRFILQALLLRALG